MNQELIKQNETVIKCKRHYLQCKLATKKLKSKLWLETDFEEEIGKKRATEKDKDAWIHTNQKYLMQKQKEIKSQLKYEHEQKVLEIMMLGE